MSQIKPTPKVEAQPVPQAQSVAHPAAQPAPVPRPMIRDWASI